MNSKELNLNVRPETLKLHVLEENVQLLNIGLRDKFFKSDNKLKRNKNQNKQAGLQEIIKFLHSKGNHQKKNKKKTF